jgi:hypothetical protein
LPIPELEGHPLSAVRDLILRTFKATFHIGGRSSVRRLRTRHAVVTGAHLSWLFVHCDRIIYLKKIQNYFERTDMYIIQF